MYQGITPELWYPQEGMKLKHPCVGLLQGAVIWGKAQEMLILEKVLKEMPDVTFYWVGDGPYRDKILPILPARKSIVSDLPAPGECQMIPPFFSLFESKHFITF